MNMIHLEKVTKQYHTRHSNVKALDKVDLTITDGEFVVVRGPSGSGKTTLLLSIGGMLRPTEGWIHTNGNDIYAMRKRDRTKFRSENIGFVFQMFHLIPYLNIIENVLLPSSAVRNQSRVTEAIELLERLNLSERKYHKPSELSAGEKQRTAIARVLLNHPKIILADEPTGNLDPSNSDEIFGYLVDFHHTGGTVIVVTHETKVNKYTDRIICLKKGRLEESIGKNK